MKDPKTIEHDPDEVPRKRTWFWDAGIWFLCLFLIALLWLGRWLTGLDFDWYQLALAFGTGAILAAWVIETTGNKVPASWRGKPPGSR